MAQNDLLSGYSASDVEEFLGDFWEMLRVSSELDRYYGKSEYQIEGYISEFDGIVDNFNRKYKGIILKFVHRVDSLQLRVFVREKNLRDFFAGSASRIKGIVSIGLDGFGEVDTSDTAKFAAAIDSIKDSLYISYSDIEAGASNVAAVMSKALVELIIDAKETSQSSADFKIIAFYALKDGIKRGISIHERLMSFGFFNAMNEFEKREWFERFSPRFLE